MRLTRFVAEGVERFGVLSDGLLADLSGAVADMGDLAAVCSAGTAGAAVVQEWAAKAPRFAPDKVRRLNPVPGRSYRVFCAGFNYRAHVQEGGFPLPSEPFIFFKLPASLIGPDDDIVRPAIVSFLDYEGELAVVIGRSGRDIPEEEALAHVLGYSAINEVSSRNPQRRQSGAPIDWFSGKALDATSPLGPYIVTRDEVGAPDRLHLETRLNGTVVQEAGTDMMTFSVPQLIAYISQRVALQPFDVIATGTPGRVGGRRSQGLHHGDLIEVEVTGVGVVSNRIVELDRGDAPAV